MFRKWYLVADQKEFRIFAQTSERNKLKLMNTIKNPLGSEKRRALIRKEAGHIMKSFGRGIAHYTQTKRHDPHEEAVNDFAKCIAGFVAKQDQQNKMYDLTIAAEPHLLGKIKSQLKGSKLKQLKLHWINKDLQKIPQQKLVEALVS